MISLKHTVLLLLCGMLATPVMAAGESDYRRDAELAVRKGLNWLASIQKEDGTWSDEKHPALTGLPLWAFARSDHPKKAAVIPKARAAVLGYVRDDGGIYRGSLLTGGLSTYNTAVCMTALHALGDPDLAPVVLAARKFVASSQYLGSDQYAGGFGYSRKTHFMHADLQNTAFAVQAMRLTADVEDLRGRDEPRIDIDWDEAVGFISRLQNGPNTGPEHAGGFAYKPGRSTAGTDSEGDGAVVLRATGSMTYSGLLSLVYARVDRDDPRVRAAMQWAEQHWSLDENPGMGDSGRYFFYNIMTRALAVYGATNLQPTGAAATVDWRRAAAEKLTALQQPGELPHEGFWVNDGSSRFWEGDAVLVTSYSILALQSVLGE